MQRYVTIRPRTDWVWVDEAPLLVERPLGFDYPGRR